MIRIMGKPRTKELLAIASIISALAAINFKINIEMDQNKLKGFTLLIGQLAKSKEVSEKVCKIP